MESVSLPLNLGRLEAVSLIEEVKQTPVSVSRSGNTKQLVSCSLERWLLEP